MSLNKYIRLSILLGLLSGIKGLNVKNAFKIKPSNCSCGEFGSGKYNFVENRIVGGRKSKPNFYPWVAVIEIKTSLCSGTVINDRYILTAGHCAFKFKIADIKVILGVYDLINLNTGKEQFYSVIKKIVHEQFLQHKVYDVRDIALLKVDPHINYNKYVTPICLPNPGEDFTGKEAMAIGWGARKTNGEPSRFLMEVDLKILSKNDCLNSALGLYYAEDTNAMLCAYRKNKDSCEGDSGGPLSYTTPEGVAVQVGIVSWGEECGLHPGIYTKVTTFVNWILKNTKDAHYCSTQKSKNL